MDIPFILRTNSLMKARKSKTLQPETIMCIWISARQSPCSGVLPNPREKLTDKCNSCCQPSTLQVGEMLHDNTLMPTHEIY